MWQLASENPIGTLCVVSGHFVFFFYIFLCLVNMFSIILCTMSNKILPYHTIRQTLQNFKICQYFYFHGIALFKHLKMSQKSFFHQIYLQMPQN